MSDTDATLPVPLVPDMIHRPDAPGLPFAEALVDHVAFDASRVTFESAPLPAA